MPTSLDDLAEMDGVILAFEFTPDGICTDYRNVTPEMAAMISKFCATVTMLFNTLAGAFTTLSEQNWIPQKGWVYEGGDYAVILGKGGYGGVFADSGKVSVDEILAALSN